MEAKNLKRFSDLTDVDIYQSSSIQEIKTDFEKIKNKLEPIRNLEINDKEKYILSYKINSLQEIS